MTDIKLEQKVKFREGEMSKKLFELFDRLNKLPLKSQEEKFDIFRSYFRGMQDGFFTCLRSIGIEPTEYQRPITEMRIDIIINNVESGKKDITSAWHDITWVSMDR